MNPSNSPSNIWKWSVCGMLFLATTLNYMDRQTFAQTSITFLPELGLTKAQYGRVERDFGFAFAIGGLFFGFLADRVRLYFLYPTVLVCWSLMGLSAAYAVEIGAFLGAATTSDRALLGFRVARAALGFFEAAQWPFAIVTTSRLLSRAERSLGNGLLQSGTALGSILTPIVVQHLVTGEPGTWRHPFRIVGLAGMAWVIPWLILMRPNDLLRPAVSTTPTAESAALPTGIFWRRFIVCAVMVIAINLPWHFFRVWLPQFLSGRHEYDRTTINYFTAAFYISADVGCIGIGFLARGLVARGWDVHQSRSYLFGLCAAGVALGALAAVVPAGPVLMSVLLIVAAAGLGLFPNYFAFSQDLSGRHQGKISGTLNFITWTVSGQMQDMVGQQIDATGSYAEPMILVSFAPLVAFVVLLIVWKQWSPKNDVGQ